MTTDAESRVPGMDSVHDATLAILAAVPRLPTRLVVRAGELAIELVWENQPTPATRIPAGAQEPAAEPPAPAAEGWGGDGICVRAPLVGVFYRAPEPGARPFVAEGDNVSRGQQVGIVEAMKMMVPVEADRAGRVVAVLKENAEPVAYDEPLFALEPASAA
jgi:acetyl-CoA carboxylase biotin carboxyl carrier protein